MASFASKICAIIAPPLALLWMIHAVVSCWLLVMSQCWKQCSLMVVEVLMCGDGSGQIWHEWWWRVLWHHWWQYTAHDKCHVHIYNTQAASVSTASAAWVVVITWMKQQAWFAMIQDQTCINKSYSDVACSIVTQNWLEVVNNGFLSHIWQEQCEAVKWWKVCTMRHLLAGWYLMH